jgi:hypothetical protein
MRRQSSQSETRGLAQPDSFRDALETQQPEFAFRVVGNPSVTNWRMASNTFGTQKFGRPMLYCRFGDLA